MADRGGRPYGSYLDRQSNPIANQGAVMAGADYDVGAKIAIQLENREVGPSAYGGSENEQNWTIAPDDILFSVPGKHGSQGNSRMAVLPALNGLGAVATARYAAEPNGLQMIREAVKNQIQLVGAAYQSLTSDRGDVERGISVQMGGLKTLRMGNNQFGDERGDTNFIKPGDLLCADVPVPGQAGLQPGVGMRAKPGVPANKYTLQLRRCSTESSGRSLRRHIREILRDPQKWQVAMGEHLSGTKAWASAAHQTMRSYLSGGLELVHELLAAGILVPSAAGAALARAETDARVQIDAALDVNVGEEGENLPSLRNGADQMTLVLAQILRVIPGNDLIDDSPASAAFNDRVRLLPMNTLQRIFWDGTNRAFEFGFSETANNMSLSIARFPRTGVVMAGTPAGDYLENQLNHFPRGVAGMHTAILNDLRFLLGKATTGASSYGSGNCHVFLGMCRQ